VTDNLTDLLPEEFLRLAVERGGIALKDVSKDLSPEAAEALRLIATSPPHPLPSETSRSMGSQKMAQDIPPRTDSLDHTRTREPSQPAGPLRTPNSRHCSACGHANQPRDRFCRKCGRPLEPLTPAVTVNDLVIQGKLSPEQAGALLDTIAHHQSSYTAGTRYSVFGRSL
jgi:hypothetical protein